MDPRELPGFKKKSFSLPFGGTEIWCEHLDGIHEYTDLAIEKLQSDYLQFKRPSMPSLIIIDIDETVVTDSLVSEIAKTLLADGKVIKRVCIVGADRKVKKKLSEALCAAHFVFGFNRDYQKAKEYMVSSAK